MKLRTLFVILVIFFVACSDSSFDRNDIDLHEKPPDVRSEKANSKSNSTGIYRFNNGMIILTNDCYPETSDTI